MLRIHPPQEYPAYKAAVAAIAALQSAGFEGYIIGGAVRDMVLGAIPKDFDVATNATPDQIHAIPDFAKTFYKDPAQAYGVSRVHMPDWPDSEIEIATFRKDIDPHRGRKATTVSFTELDQDVQRRDFTINALAYDPLHDALVDHVGGIEDIAKKRIRFIGRASDRTAEDPLRILRAIRFKNALGFHYAKETAAALLAAVQAGQVEKIATDRIRQELSRMLMHPSRRQSVTDLDRFNILDRVLPELTRGKGVAQPPEIHAEGDVWTHQLLAIDALPALTSERLAWATLLHDIGKPPTQTLPIGPHDRIRFNRHYAVGAEMAHGILRRLNFSNKMTRDICWMIEHHINIDDVPHMRAGHQRAMLDHPAFTDLLELHKADAMATWPPSGPHKKPPQFPALEVLWHHHQTVAAKLPRPSLKKDLGIDGHWVHQKFPITKADKSGALIGHVLEVLTIAYENDGVTSKTELTALAKKTIQSKQENQ